MLVEIKSNLVKILVLWILVTLTACAPTPTPTPTVPPTSANRLMPQDNQNSRTLDAAQAELDHIEFGFAPLLELDNTRLVVETGPDGEFVRLAYPPQPTTPTDWISADSFVLAYSVRDFLLDLPHVRRISLGSFEVAAPIEAFTDRINHYAAWVRFADGSEAVVDLSPLATNFAAYHRVYEFITTDASIETEFVARRSGVPLNVLQPMAVVTRNGNVYYLAAKVLTFPDRYEFSLRVHLTQTATPTRPLQLTRGTMTTLEINRVDFETVQKIIIDAGPSIFNQRPELLGRVGDEDPALAQVLDEHLLLLWHMVTKLETDQGRSSGTPAPTITPLPTLTPTPTPTSTPIPLLTS